MSVQHWMKDAWVLFEFVSTHTDYKQITDIECGGGFYVRSLVDDLGKALSSCAHVKSLTRTKQGQFTLEEHALREDHWTLEHVLRVFQPCPGLDYTAATQLKK